MSEIEDRLSSLFEADLNDPAYYTIHGVYELNKELGCKPWWPPLTQVWQRQGKPVQYENQAVWRDAWTFLSELYQEYLAAKEQGGNANERAR